MSADSDAVESGVESVGLRFVHEWQYHAAQGGVRVDVGIRDRQVVEDCAHFVDVVHCALHRRADVCHEDDGHVAVDSYGFVEVVVIDLAVALALYHDVADFQEAEYLDDAVVRVLGEVDNAVGENLAAHV